MKSEVEVLQYIAQNVQMGIIGIDDIKKYIDEEKFSKLIKEEKEEFEHLYDEALKLLEKYNKDCKDISPISKLSSNIMSKFVITKDNKEPAIAKMMIEGTNKGIIAITEKLNNYKINNIEILKLGEKLKATLEHNVDDLKEYL